MLGWSRVGYLNKDLIESLSLHLQTKESEEGFIKPDKIFELVSILEPLSLFRYPDVKLVEMINKHLVKI
jgi:hypothetical protein